MDALAVLADIRWARAEGHALDDLFINDGNESWGADGVAYRANCEALIVEWQADGCQGDPSLGDLETAEEWALCHAEEIVQALLDRWADNPTSEPVL